MILHAGLVALGRRGVLITGPSGAGKSDLALRALEAGFRLVADDRTLVWTSGGRLYGKAPESLAGLVEIRGLGVVGASALAFAEIVLVCAGVEEVERMPEPAHETMLGLTLPRLDLRLLEPSAPAKLRHALMHLGDRA